MATKKRVAIIGAGVSGLVSIKSCLEEDGIEPTCFERHDKLGGLWYHTPELRPGQGAAVYDSIVSNTSKEMMAFSDFPMPEEYTPYFSHQQALRYLQDYAAHFDLEKYIRYETDVTNIEEGKEEGYWKIHLETQEGATSVEYFDYVMVCTGPFNKARIPDYPGQESFKGIKIHANEYRNASKLKGKKVIVVGGSLTGVEVACEVAREGAQVLLSMRHGVTFIPRINQDGMPFDFSTFTRSRCKSATNVLEFVKNLAETRVRNQRIFGIQSEEPYPLSKGFVITDDMQDRIVQGQIKPVVDIKEFQDNDVILKDGTTLVNVDAVIFATGYKYAIPIIDKEWIYDESDKVNLFKYAFPVRYKHPERLAFICVLIPYGPTWQLSELHARLAVRVFTGKIVLPDKATMQRDIDQKIKYVGDKLTYVEFPVVEDVAEFLGVKPSFWRLLVSDPKLAMQYQYGPMVPYWYRLQGPGAWSGARDRILNAIPNTLSALKGYPSFDEKK